MNIPRVRYLLAVLLALAILAMVPVMGLAQAPITDDTYVTQTRVTTNFGASTSLAVQAGTQPTYTYMTFSTSQVPNGSSVTKATLRLFVTAVTTAGAFDIRLANGPWSEGAIKWSNQPGGGPGSILLAGSCPSPIPANADPTHPLCITKGQVNDYIILDISSQVQAWVTNPASNYGIVLVPTPGYSTSITFDSKESTTTSHDPTLNIVVTGAAGAAATVAVGGTTTGAAGTAANVSNTGTTSAAILNFTIPQGATGPAGPPGPQGPTGGTGPQGSAGAAATVAVGSTTTGTPGTAANVSNAGTTSAAILNFTIPQGATGATGSTGLQGPQGQMGPVGPQGLQGTQGPIGPQGPVGAGVTAKGAFVQGTSYAANDVVNYGAASYVALLANHATLTPDNDATNWAVFAATGPKGDKGDTGTTGPQGVPGPQGVQGLQGLVGPLGPPGPQGQQGVTGATGQGYTWKGAWSAAAAYAAYDSVFYNGSSYVALGANSNVTPGTDATKWDLLAQASLVGNFVDLQSNQIVGGTKTFSSTITGNISGSAGTISGTITKSQVSDFPALAAAAMSGSYGDLLNRPALAASIAASSHKFLASYDAAAGTFAAAQPALGDLSDASSVMTTSTAVQASQMPFLIGDVMSPSGTAVTTLRAGLNIRTCEVHVWGSGPSGVLQLTDGEAASCRNKFGVTWTITSVECWANAGTTTAVRPQVTGGANSTILSSALTCGNGFWTAGTLNGMPTLLPNGTVDINVTAADASTTNIRVVISGTI